jgi:hypothetical protein
MTVTVADLIEKLAKIDPCLPVYFVADGTGNNIDPCEPAGMVAVVSFHGAAPHECLLLAPKGLLPDEVRR